MTTSTKMIRKSTRQGTDAPSLDETLHAPSPRPLVKQFRFGYLVHDISRIRRIMMDQVMRPLGITRSQWLMLSTLSRGGNNGLMQVDIARLLETGKVTVGGLVERLETSGHVERRPDPQDGRAKRVYISKKGFDVITQMIEVAAYYNRRILEGIDPKDVAATERTLMKVKQNIKDVIASEAAGSVGHDLGEDEGPDLVHAL